MVRIGSEERNFPSTDDQILQDFIAILCDEEVVQSITYPLLVHLTRIIDATCNNFQTLYYVRLYDNPLE